MEEDRGVDTDAGHSGLHWTTCQLEWRIV